MAIGRVKWFDEARGYGFVAVEGGPEVFVHISAAQAAGLDTLRSGQRLEFLIERDRQGRARAVELKAL